MLFGKLLAANRADTFVPNIAVSRWSIVNDGLALSFSSLETKLSEQPAASATFFNVKPRTRRACRSLEPIFSRSKAPWFSLIILVDLDRFVFLIFISDQLLTLYLRVLWEVCY
jgi:hypothetical protein